MYTVYICEYAICKLNEGKKDGEVLYDIMIKWVSGVTRAPNFFRGFAVSKLKNVSDSAVKELTEGGCDCE